MQKITAIIALAIIVVIALAGAFVLMNQGHDSSDGDSVTITDMLGVEVTVKKNPEHVACISRTTYDPLVAFGLGDRIDGAYNTLLNNPWTSILYPDSSKHYAYPYEPSYELLLERNVDLVLCPEAYIAEGLREHGIPAMTVCLYGNPDFSSYVYFIPEMAKQLWPDVAGVKEKADSWSKDFKKVLDEVKGTLSGKDLGDKSVFYVRGDKNKGIGYTDTGKSFNEYIFGVLGYDFLGKTMGTTKPSVEAILQADPDVFVIGGQYQYVLESMLSESTWENVSAVKSGSIYRIGMAFSPMEQLGAFSPVFLADMANKLYSDYFDFDTMGMLEDIAKRYFSIELSDLQASYILEGLGPDGKPMV